MQLQHRQRLRELATSYTEGLRALLKQRLLTETTDEHHRQDADLQRVRIHHF